MKMFAVLALAAVAFAEPEPQVVYSRASLSPVFNTPYTYNTPYAYSSPLLRSFSPYSAYNGVYRTPVVHSLGKRDADAEPATVYTTGLPVTSYGAVHHVAGVNSVVAPVTTYSANQVVPATYAASHVVPATYSASHVVPATYAASHVVPATYAAGHVAYNAVNHVAAPVSTYVAAPVTHSLTSYNNPSHYTAVSNGAFGPKYIAKNHGVEHVVKRDADAEPATVYAAGVPVTSYGAVHHVAGVNSVVAPVSTYSAVSPVVSYAANHVVPATYAASHVVPATYAANHVVPATYAAGHVVKGAYAPHAVAATPFGYTHSSNVGVCTNNMGVQVAC